MTIEVLNKLNTMLSSVINYEFERWTSNPVPYPYWVGEYMEEPSEYEDGLQVSTFTLTGTTRGTWLDLERDKKKIEKLCNSTMILENGDGLAVFYLNALTIPTDDLELKRLQIDLQIKNWKVG